MQINIVMPLRILFYGNCQLRACMHTLNVVPEHIVRYIPCWKGNISKQEFTSLVKTSDIIITQPINDNYKNVDYLSTRYVIQHKAPHCKVVIVENCYFQFYYIDLTYKQHNNSVLHEPVDYHYDKMIECYRAKKPISYYVHNIVHNVNLKTKEELDAMATDSLNELRRRHAQTVEKYGGANIFVIQTHDYIEQHYRDKLLFYSMNHPSKHVVQYACEQIIRVLDMPNTINYAVDVLRDTKCILYKCVAKSVNFNIDAHPAATCGRTNVADIARLYYETYARLGYV